MIEYLELYITNVIYFCTGVIIGFIFSELKKPRHVEYVTYINHDGTRQQEVRK